MTLWLDVNRDYTSGYALAIDCRGHVHESCFGDATWNPKWYVAAACDDRSWTVEAAIPLAELVARAPQAGDAWAIAAARVTASGQQPKASGAARNYGGDEYGLLIFR